MPMRVTRSDLEVTDKELELINQHAVKALTRDEVFVYEGICSSDELDSYDTRMDPHTTLKNFAAELIDGVALLEGHDTNKNPYGRSFYSEVIEKEGTTSVRGRWYIPRGITLNGVNSDDTIRGIESGIIRDMSVGFGGNDVWYKCSADGKDLWDTPYYPGDMDEEGNRVFFWIMDAHLREVSTVYKGACPGAYIEKARSAISDGGIDDKRITVLEERYQTRFDRGVDAFFDANKRKEKERANVSVLDSLRAELKENKLERKAVYEVLAEGGETFRQPEDIAIRNVLGERATEEGVKLLLEEADSGRAYVADLIETAVKERVAAQGDTFNSESYQKALERSSDIDYIKDEIESYRKQKGNKFSAGRQTGNGNGDDDRSDDVLDSELYKGGQQ